MTTSNDSFVGTSANDLFTADAGTLGAKDIIIDSTATDNDTLNVTYNATQVGATATLTPTVSGVENINVNIDAFAGTATTVNATNISGAKITLSSDKAGFDGAAGVTNAGDNAIVAGTNVTNLTVAGVGSTVDAGSAKTVSVTTDATLVTAADLTVNGDVTSLTVGTATTLDLSATADSTVTWAAGNGASGTVTTVNVDTANDVTFKGLAADLTGLDVNNNGTGKIGVNVTNDAVVNLGKYDADTVSLVTAYGSVATLNKDVAVTAAGTLATGAGLTNASTLKSGVAGSTIDLTLNGAVADLGVNAFENLDLHMSKDTSVGVITFTPGALITADTKVAVDGSGDLTLATTVGVDTVDASALEGDLTYDSGTLDQTVKGGTGANAITTGATGTVTYVGQNGGDTIDAATAAGTLSVETGTGVDTLNITALAGGRLIGNLGAGDDVVNITGTTNISTGGQLILDGGAGDDTLKITLASNLTGAATGSDVSNFETLKLVSDTTAGTETWSMASFVLSGNEMAIESARTDTTAPTAANYTIHVDDGAASTTASTVDLSGLTFSALKPIEAINVTTGTKADTVTGANLSSGMTSTIDTNAGDDTVIVGSGAGITTVNIEAGANTIDLSNATAANELYFASTAAGSTIDGWKAVTKLDFEGVTGGTAVTESVTSADTNALVSGQVYFINTTGEAANFTLSGTAVVTDFASTNQVSAYLNEHFGPEASPAAGDDNIFIINDTRTDADTSYIYEYTEAVVINGTIEATELVLLGTVNNGGTALNTSNYDDTIA